VLILLAALAAAAGLLALYMSSMSASRAASAEEASERLAEERALGARHERFQSDKFAIAADMTEAHSSEFITGALHSCGVSVGNIDYGDPKEAVEKFDKVETTINIKDAKFAALMGFLKKVQEERPQVRLVKMSIERSASADLWNGSVVYGALIPAKPRN
jgi:hypothetical protein